MHLRTNLLIPLAVFSALSLAGCAAETGDAASTQASHTRDNHDATKPATKDKIKHRKVRIKKSIPYSRDIVKTSTLDKGVTVVDQRGEPGVRIRVVRVALQHGVEVGRDLISSYVKHEPVQQITLVGTHVDPKPAPAPSNCDPNYAGACVPIASDVDCAGGSGDGPEYVDGPVQVVGEDVYDLNRDGDNIACDS